MVTKRLRVYAFIDSQNLNLGISKNIYKGHKLIYSGWSLDYTKFRRYLRDKYYVEKAYIFIGYIPKYKPMYKSLRESGFNLVFKPVVHYKGNRIKGNVDIELAIHSVKIMYEEYDKGIFVSGDGDFYYLYSYLKDKGKLGKILIPNQFSESSLLNDFNKYKIYIQKERGRLELKSGRRRSLPRR